MYNFRLWDYENNKCMSAANILILKLVLTTLVCKMSSMQSLDSLLSVLGQTIIIVSMGMMAKKFDILPQGIIYIYLYEYIE